MKGRAASWPAGLAPEASGGDGAGPSGGELMLHGTACYGACPTFTAVFEASGSVWYHGLTHAPHQGVRTGRIPAHAVNAVLRKARVNGFLDARYVYENDTSDVPTIYTGVLVERVKLVSNYDWSAPDAVEEIERAARSLLEVVVWDEVPRIEPGTPATCEAYAKAIEIRCAGAERAGDCRYFRQMLYWLLDEGDSRTSEVVHAGCARHLRSLRAAVRRAR